MDQAANDRQHGGNHYKKLTYQHWDWICDIRLPYLLACATKYVARWRDKNGKEDLEKAIHYLEKAMEKGVHVMVAYQARTNEFCNQLEPYDADIVQMIVSNTTGDYAEAIGAIDFLIEEGA